MPPMPSMPVSPPALFPTYLIPSLPFRRRKSSTDSTSTISTSPPSPSIHNNSPPAPPSFLSGATSHLRCARCSADLAASTQIISKGFTGRHGRAYLVAPHPSASANLKLNHHTLPYSTLKAKNDALPNLPNTYTHKPVPRQLVTGAHTVGDISCAVCGSVLGWKYVAAEEEGQRYKVGKFILETKRVCRAAVWEGEEDEAFGSDGAVQKRHSRPGGLPPNELPTMTEEVEFDSQDEEECEDLFMGVWTPDLAKKRRRARRFAKEDD
jgi:hypothetical protein